MSVNKKTDVPNVDFLHPTQKRVDRSNLTSGQNSKRDDKHVSFQDGSNLHDAEFTKVEDGADLNERLQKKKPKMSSISRQAKYKYENLAKSFCVPHTDLLDPMSPDLTTRQDRGLLVKLQENEDAEMVSENVKRSRHELHQTQKTNLVMSLEQTQTIESQFPNSPLLSNFSNEQRANTTKASPLNIAGQIVGSNHFEQYNVRIDPNASKGTILPGSMEQNKKLTQFLENEAIEVINQKQIIGQNGKKKTAGNFSTSPNQKTKGKKSIRYKTNFEISGKNQDPDHPQYEQNYLQNFDLEQFEFFDENNPEANKKFVTNFKNAQDHSVNKHKSFKLITELIYSQLIDKMNSDDFEGDKIPPMMRENSLRWCSLITKTPRLQSFYNQFQEQLSKLLQHEIRNNKDLYDMYMTQPRERLCHTVGPKKRSPMKHGGLSSDKNSTDRLIRRLSQDPMLNETQNIAAFLHPKIRETFPSKQKMKGQMEQAKVNYQKMKEFKKSKAMKNVGVNKVLQKEVDEGRADTIAEAALLRNKEKYGNLTVEEIQHERTRLKIKAQKITEKILLARDKKKPMNQFQLDVKQRAEAINELINSVEDNNIDLKNIVEMTETDLDTLEGERDPKTVHIIPGDQIGKLMQMWGNEEVYSASEIQKWSVDLWMSLQDYEKSLVAEEKGFKIMAVKKEKAFQAQVQRLKQVSLFRFEAMQTALVQTKMNMNREKERLEMRIAEMESTRMNEVEDDQAVDSLVQQFGDGERQIQNVNEAKIIIKQFVKIVKGKDITIRENKKYSNKQKALVDVLEERLFDKDSIIKEESILRQYYQKILLKAVRDLKVFDHDKKALNMFQTVFEDEDEINYQRQIKIVLENIDLAKAMDNHANKYYGHIEGIEKLNQNLALIAQLDTEIENERNWRADEELVSSASASSINSVTSRVSVQTHKSRGLFKGKNNGTSSKASLAGGFKRASPNRAQLGRSESNAGSKFKKLNIALHENKRMDTQGAIDSGSEIASPRPRIRMNPKSKFSMASKFKTSQGRGRNTGNVLDKNSVARQAAREQMVIILQKAKEGNIEKPLINQSTGAPKIDQQAARKEMVDILEQIDPEALENFKFLDLNQDKLKKKMEVTMRDLQEAKGKGKKMPKLSKRQVTEKNSFLNSPVMEKEKVKKDAPGYKNQGTMKEGKNKKGSKHESKKEKAVPDSVMNMTLLKNAEPVERIKDRSDHKSNLHESMASLHSKNKELGFGSRVSKQDFSINQGLSPYQSEAESPRKQKKPRKRKRRDKIRNGQNNEVSPEVTLDIRLSENSAGSFSSDSSEDGGGRNSSLSQDQGEREPKMSQFARAAARQKQTHSGSSLDSNSPDAPQRNGYKNPSARLSQSFDPNTHRLQKSSSNISNANRNNGNKFIEIEGDSIQKNKKGVNQALKKPKQKIQNLTVIFEPSSGTASPDMSQQKSRFKKSQKSQGYKMSIQEPRLNGVCLIQNELNELVATKYSEKIQAATKAYNNAKDKFKLATQQVQEMREHVQLCMNGQMAPDDYSSLFKLEIDQFFKELNYVLVKHFDFTFINKYVKNGIKNPGSEDKVRVNITSEQQQARKESLHKVNFGDMIKPNFSETGQMLGFELRAEMTSMLFMNNQYELKQLKRVIRVCVYMNRLIQEGHKDDFLITQIEDGQLKQPPKKQFHDFQVQVKGDDIDEAMAPSEQEYDGEDQGTPRTRNHRMLKNHLIGIIARQRPQKVGYYNMIWEQMTTDKMMSQVMENVFLNDQDKADHVEMTYRQYLNTVLPRLVKGAQDIEDPVQKDMLTIDNLFKQVGDRIIPPEVKAQCVGTFIHQATVNVQTDKIAPVVQEVQSKGMKKSKNQFILDQAMEQEFLKTLQLFDGFAQTLCKIDESILKKKPITDMEELEQINEDMQQEAIQQEDLIKSMIKPGFQVQIKVVGEDDFPQKTNKSGSHFGKNNNSSIEQLDDLSKYRNKLQDQIQNMQKDLRFQVLFKKANKMFRDKESPKGVNEDLLSLSITKDKFETRSRRIPKQKQNFNFNSSSNRSPKNSIQGSSISKNITISPRGVNHQEMNMLRRHNQTAGLMTSQREILKMQKNNKKKQEPTTGDILSIKGVFSENQGEGKQQPLSPHDDNQAFKRQQTYTKPETVRYTQDDQLVTTERSSQNSQNVEGVFDVNSTDLDSLSYSNYNKIKERDYDRRMHYPYRVNNPNRDTTNYVQMDKPIVYPNKREQQTAAFEDHYTRQRYMEIEGKKCSINQINVKDRIFSPSSKYTTQQKQLTTIQKQSGGPQQTMISTELPKLNLGKFCKTQTKQEVLSYYDEGEVIMKTNLNTDREQIEESNKHLNEGNVTTQLDERRNLAFGSQEQIHQISSKYSPSQINSPSLRPVGSNQFKDYIQQNEFGPNIHGQYGEDFNEDSMLSPTLQTSKAVPASVLDQALRPVNKNQDNLSNEIRMLGKAHRAMNQSVNYSNNERLVNWQYQMPLDEFGQIQKQAQKTGRKVHTNVSQVPWNQYTNHENLKYLTRNKMIERVIQFKRDSTQQKKSKGIANSNLLTLSLQLDKMKTEMQMQSAKKAATTKHEKKQFNNLSNKVEFQQLQQKQLKSFNICIDEPYAKSSRSKAASQIKNGILNLNCHTIESVDKQQLNRNSTLQKRKANVDMFNSYSINHQEDSPLKQMSMESKKLYLQNSGYQSTQTRLQESGVINDNSIKIVQKKVHQRGKNVLIKNERISNALSDEFSPARAWSRMTKSIMPPESPNTLSPQSQQSNSVQKRTFINMGPHTMQQDNHSEDNSQPELQTLPHKLPKNKKR